MIDLQQQQQQQLQQQQPRNGSPPLSPPYSPPTNGAANIITNNVQTKRAIPMKSEGVQKAKAAAAAPVVLNQNGNIVTVSDLSNVKIPIPKVVKPGK